MADVTNTQNFIKKVLSHKKDETYEWFYRGHYEMGHPLEPKLFRTPSHKKNEDRLFREIQVLNPLDFAGDISTLDKLVRMQHYALPTRSLDITSNPLIALYFACKNLDKKISAKARGKAGEVIVLKIKRGYVKFYDSDTGSCLANLANLGYEEKENIRKWICAQKREDIESLYDDDDDDIKPDPNQYRKKFRELTGRLLHFIKQEKPYFLPIIRPDHLKSVICVRTRFNNTRITSQVGAFLLFGLNATLPEAGNTDIEIKRIPISSEKESILRELDTLNINESTVFPYIENSAKYLAAKYRRKSQ
jgi:hypothetical protein